MLRTDRVSSGGREMRQRQKETTDSSTPNSTEQVFLQANNFSVKTFLTILAPEGSLPHSPELATGPILSHMNPVHNVTLRLFRFILIFSSHIYLVSLNYSLSLDFATKTV